MGVLFDDEPDVNMWCRLHFAECANIFSSLILMINYSDVICIIIPCEGYLLREVFKWIEM